MDLSVVIPTKGRLDDLLRTVGAVLAQSRLPDELVIVDQSPTNLAAAAVDRMAGGTSITTLRYIWDASIDGLPKARNVGFTSSTGQLICFLDDDTLPTGDYLEEVERGFASFPEWSGICGRVTEQRPASRFRALCRGAFRLGLFADERAAITSSASPRAIRLLIGAAFCLRRTVLERFQFDEGMIGYALGEDVEFSLRAGTEFLFGFYPSARVIHTRSLIGRPSHSEMRLMARRSARLLWRSQRQGILDDLAYAWLKAGFAIEAAFGDGASDGIPMEPACLEDCEVAAQR